MCQERGYLEDVEGSWPETWRTWLFLTSWMMFFYPKVSWCRTWRTGSSLTTWMTLSSMSPVKNTQHPPSTPLLDPPFLGVKKHHSWHQEQSCPPCLRSGSLNVLQVPPYLTTPSWHTSNWDVNMKFSGYLPWGKKTSFMTSGTTMSSMSLVRNP